VLDVDRNEIYEGLPIKKYSYHQQFIDEVLNYCIGRPAFIVDNAPWLKHALEELGLTYNTKPFR
jgi:transposase-like protein